MCLHDNFFQGYVLLKYTINCQVNLLPLSNDYILQGNRDRSVLTISLLWFLFSFYALSFILYLFWFLFFFGSDGIIRPLA